MDMEHQELHLHVPTSKVPEAEPRAHIPQAKDRSSREYAVEERSNQHVMYICSLLVVIGLTKNEISSPTHFGDRHFVECPKAFEKLHADISDERCVAFGAFINIHSVTS